jgi:hypothetical protein
MKLWIASVMSSPSKMPSWNTSSPQHIASPNAYGPSFATWYIPAIIFQPVKIISTASENTGTCESKSGNARTMPSTPATKRFERLVSAPAMRLVELFAKPSRFVIPPKKLDTMFADHITSRLLFELDFRPSGSICSMAALLITCSITSISMSIRAKSTISTCIMGVIVEKSGNGHASWKSMRST